MNDRHEEMAQATTKGRQLAIQWWQDRLVISQDFEGLIKSIDSALSRIEAETEARVLEIAAKVCKDNQFISGGPGPLFGAGWNAAVEHTAKAILALSSTANELSTTQELADGYVRVPRGAIIATSIEADFEKGTWTFEPKGQWSVGAGDYYLIPIQAAEKGE